MPTTPVISHHSEDGSIQPDTQDGSGFDRRTRKRTRGDDDGTGPSENAAKRQKKSPEDGSGGSKTATAEKPKLAHTDYTVGWVCALPIERAAATVMLSQRHADLSKPKGDSNTYTLGSVEEHNVVIACLPKGQYGLVSAATVATQMVNTFPSVKLGLLVGIGGGIPPKVRLGDIVISTPKDSFPGIIQWDMGKAKEGGNFERTGALNNPPTALLTALTAMEAEHEITGSKVPQYLDELKQKWPNMKDYLRPDSLKDILFRANYSHIEKLSMDTGDDEDIETEQETDEEESCQYCDTAKAVKRKPRQMRLHYGLIASGNQVIKNATLRDNLSKDIGAPILCVEMEAAGLKDNFPCLVIRGICDYADSHKNKAWQKHAAAIAAAAAKELLGHVQLSDVESERPLKDILSQAQIRLNHIQATMTDARMGVEAIRSDRHVDKIKCWLSPSDPSSNANSAREKRHDRSGTWFLNSNAFKEWKVGSRQHIWLHGISGCGKTVLSTTVLDHLTSMSKHTILEFFFDFSDPAKQHVSDMLRVLIFQLYRKQPALGKELDRRFIDHDNGQKQPTEDTLSKILQEMLQLSEKVYIILDALDECTQRVPLLKWLKGKLLVPGLGHVQLIATGRPEAEFQSQLCGHLGVENCIPIDKDSVNADIRSYVLDTLKKADGFQRWATRYDVVEEIQQQVAGKADGMFRLAACQLEILQDCVDLAEVKAALASLPQTLTGIYGQIMMNIPKRRKEKAIRLLQFLVYTERPLTLQEAVDVLVTSPNEGGSFDPDDRMPCPTEITMFCPSLVSLTQSSDSDMEVHIQLSHLTVKEYFLQLDKEEFNPIIAATAITQTCLAYLSCLSEESIDIIVKRFPLAKYAARIWMDHARVAESEKTVRIAAVHFLEAERTFRVWTSLFELNEIWGSTGTRSRARPTALYFACYKGLKGVAMNLSSTKDVNAQGGAYGNALQAASVGGYQEIVQMLLDKGAHINAQGGQYGNALQAA